MKSFGITDVGKKRSMNQDSIFYTDEPIGAISNLYIVAVEVSGTKILCPNDVQDAESGGSTRILI